MRDLLNEKRNTDMLIFGLDTGKIDKQFSIGDLTIIPKFDLERYLKGYQEDTVGFITDYAKYGQFRPQPQSPSLFFSPMVEDVCLLPFRLFKSGWISAMPIAPITRTNGLETRCELDITRHLFGQIWADGNYELAESEISLIQGAYNRSSAVPKGYLEMAMRRFSRSYKYIQHNEYAGTSELDDYWVDLVIALESMTSKDERSLTENMARRAAILLANGRDERQEIKAKVRDIYRQRCSIVHGNEKDMITDATHEKRFLDAEALRTVIRDMINSSIDLLIKHSASLVDSSGHRRILPDIIEGK